MLIPPATGEGATLTNETLGGTTENVVCVLVDPVVAVIVTKVELATGVVVTVSFAAVAPAGTVMVPASEAAALLLATVTGKPPVGAAPFR